jgi:WD40 repeat protein
LWNGETADEIRVASRPGLAALALSGDLLAAASAGGDVELHEAASGRTLGVLQTGEGGVSSLALGPGPGRLATGAEDGGVRLREREGGFTLLALPGQGGRITAIAFSPPAAALAAASADGTLTIREGKPAQGRRPTSDVDER